MKLHPKPFFTNKEKIGRQVLKNVYWVCNLLFSSKKIMFDKISFKTTYKKKRKSLAKLAYKNLASQSLTDTPENQYERLICQHRLYLYDNTI